MQLSSEQALVSAARALGADRIPTLSETERRRLSAADIVSGQSVCSWKGQIQSGHDPLGDAFCRIRPPLERRGNGATFTPARIIEAMTRWALEQGQTPDRIVDPGTGSGRFLLKAAQAFPDSRLCGIEIDPLAALIARANLAATGLDERSQILISDYRSVELPRISGKTLFIGNPPYVRHHQIEPRWKAWLSDKAGRLGAPVSRLAGLHAYFFLSTVLQGKPGDLGAFITSSEWLDVNYGKLIRHLFLDGMGGQSITVIDPKIRVFEDAAATAAICCFKLGSRSKVYYFKHVDEQGGGIRLGDGNPVKRQRLESEQRWSQLVFSPPPKLETGFIQLGEICSVHRGQVTGANRIWIEGPHSAGLPESVLYPCVTRASELFQAGQALTGTAHLRRVIDIPADLSAVSNGERDRVEAFLQFARQKGVPKGYIASSRKAWWSVGLRVPAPILMTYMARRPPAFVRNLAKARHLNIAHGLYPRTHLSEHALQRLAHYLSTRTSMQQGRCYAGGLVKFEPKEVERLPVPSPELLEQANDDPASEMEPRPAH